MHSPNCFNSCPREGAIGLSSELRFTALSFQLMPPRGGNPLLIKPKSSIVVVSTHAPARGQSLCHLLCSANAQRFNSCPREGAIISAMVSFYG